MSGAWTPDAAALDEVERRVRLPEGAKPLGDYVRYYAGGHYKGHAVVEGYFVGLDGDEKPGRRIVPKERFPGIMDGGCGVVDVGYDLDAHRQLWALCNGIA